MLLLQGHRNRVRRRKSPDRRRDIVFSAWNVGEATVAVAKDVQRQPTGPMGREHGLLHRIERSNAPRSSVGFDRCGDFRFFDAKRRPTSLRNEKRSSGPDRQWKRFRQSKCGFHRCSGSTVSMLCVRFVKPLSPCPPSIGLISFDFHFLHIFILEEYARRRGNDCRCSPVAR